MTQAIGYTNASQKKPLGGIMRLLSDKQIGIYIQVMR